MQTTDTLLMVRPSRFAFNEETAGNNAFQKKSDSKKTALLIQQQAVSEFDSYSALLRENGIKVLELQDTPEPFTPDSIFPNNCFSTHYEDSIRTLVLYPMFAPNRREERVKLMLMLGGMTFDKVVDLTKWEKEEKYLEGTGSLILDREHHIAYACHSPRTNEEVVRDWASQLGFGYFLFDSIDENGMAVYHTNVVMHVGTRFAIVCLDSIRNVEQRERLETLLKENGKDVVAITMAQMNNFAGNMLEVRNEKGEKLLVMSTTAYKSLTPKQKDILSSDLRFITPDISAIETAGGGSARCMIAEIY